MQFFLSLTYIVHICEAWAGAINPSSFKNPGHLASRSRVGLPYLWWSWLVVAFTDHECPVWHSRHLPLQLRGCDLGEDLGD